MKVLWLCLDLCRRSNGKYSAYFFGRSVYFLQVVKKQTDARFWTSRFNRRLFMESAGNWCADHIPWSIPWNLLPSSSSRWLLAPFFIRTLILLLSHSLKSMVLMSPIFTRNHNFNGITLEKVLMNRCRFGCFFFIAVHMACVGNNSGPINTEKLCASTLRRPLRALH